MTKKTGKSISELSNQEREALAEKLFEKAVDSSKRNCDDPEERYTEDIIDKAIALYPKPEYYYVKANELFWQYSMWDETDIMDEIRESPYTKPSSSLTDISDKYRELLELTFKALELNPEYSQAYYMSARIYNQLGDYDKALVDINKALSMRLESSFYYDTFHEILLNRGDLTGALTAINKALELNPDGYRLREDKCNLLTLMGRYQEAIDFLLTFPVKDDYSPLIVYFDISVPLLIRMNEKDKSSGVLIDLINDSYRMFSVSYLLTDLYEQGEYNLLAGLPLIEKKMTLKVLWILFWANIHVGDYVHAREFLAAMHFNKELTTDTFDHETIDLDELTDKRKETSSKTAEMNDEKASVNQSSKNHYSIFRLFSLSQPYEKVPMDLFLLLLRKIFNGRYARQYFERRIVEIGHKWESEPELVSRRSTYGEQFYDISLKIMLLGDAARFVYKLNKKKSVLFSLLQNAMNTSLMSAMNSIMLNVQLDERNRILSNLSHSIKNMLKSVIDPLINLREEIPQKAVIIDNAIKGANLIREIVNAINLSFKTTLEELKWDVLNPGQEFMTLQDMIHNSLRYSVSNMFDFRYFPTYAGSYFPSSIFIKDFELIKTEWNKLSSNVDMAKLKGFLDKYMFRLELSLDESGGYHVGNEKSSAIKLMILFQEIIFNAIKYASFVPRKDRFVTVELIEHKDKLRLEVKNSYHPEVQAKTTGVGKLVIENFAKVLDCSPETSTDNNVYSITMEFDNIWRKNAKDSLH